MFLGHFAVAFAARPAAPSVSLGTPLDFVHYPWTHSLLMCALWAAAFGLLYLLIRGNRRGAVVVGAGVLSHWLLDFLVHRPDLPLAPFSETRWGLGIWNSIPATLAIEGALFTAALAYYVRRTRPSVQAIAWAGLTGGIITALLGYWLDRHRALRS